MKRRILLSVAMFLMSCGGSSGGGNGGGAGSGGGGNGGGSCGTVQPCGGSVVGTWNISTVCVLDSSFLGFDQSQICAGAQFDVASVSAMGTSTYNADGTYQDTGNLKLTFKLTVPNSCFSNGATCAGLNSSFQQQIQQDPSSVNSASCVPSGSSCVCTLGSPDQPVSEMGTYTTSGTSLTTTPTGGTPSTGPYCVTGNELHEMQIDMSMPMGSMGMAHIQADVVLKK
jgi:hypothetical protein